MFGQIALTTEEPGMAKYPLPLIYSKHSEAAKPPRVASSIG